MRLPTLEQFLAKPRFPNNSYVTEPGFSDLYVRHTTRRFEGKLYDTLDIGRVIARKPGKGTFTRLLARLHNQYPHLTIYVECVMNPRFAKTLVERLGFKPAGLDEAGTRSYYLLNDQKTEAKGIWQRGDPMSKGKPYIVPLFYGKPIPRTELEGGTWLDREELAYNTHTGAPSKSKRRAYAVCFDGKLRTFKVGIPDTFFSIPAIGEINGCYVHGWIEIKENKVVFHRQSRYKPNQCVIKHDNGTYYKEMTGIGPCFGGTLQEAKRFPDCEDADRERGLHWGFTATKIEEIKNEQTQEGIQPVQLTKTEEGPSEPRG